MKYQIKKLHINDFDVFMQNKIQARAYFIPYVSKQILSQQSTLTERYSSDTVQVLSGEWQFKYYEKISRLPGKIDTDSMSFDSIVVPSTWQRTGYEAPYYLNTRYQFPMNLPNVPEEMSAGVYVKKFTLTENAVNPVITFLGVCSSLTLYVNGEYVGYSEGSHNMAEFSLKGIAKPGENELLAIVSKWCNGTYLECQDMFRENGIFRDVYITENPNEYIFDYEVKTVKKDNGYTLDTSVCLMGADFSGKKISAELCYNGETVAEKTADASKSVDFAFGVLDVKQWNAEKPELYTLYISLYDDKGDIECVRAKIGFKDVKIVGELFLFNEMPIKFKGVNHHDTHQSNGYVMSAEDLLKDVLLMKQFNVNAVRMSHYPPDPILLDLCDEYGLYVIDEADIETHGTQFDEKLRYTCKPNVISNGKEWLPRFIDRVMSMYQRDKNHVSITMWSLGNESGGWKNQEVCYNMLKKISSIPVHYEAVIRTPKGSFDVISEMYQHPPVLKKIGEHKLTARYKGKPYFLCEYCHAMGVGPGSLEDYWELIYKYDQLCGGCIWEWADHSVYDEKAKYKYTYGGDHGEKYHDGNFCVDGLFYPDRTPHTGAYEMKVVYRPIRAKRVKNNLYLFRNTNSFTNASEFTVKFELLENGAVIDEGNILLDIKPGEYKEIAVDHITDFSLENEYHINFIYYKGDTFVAKEQIALLESVCDPLDGESAEVSFEEKKGKIIVSFKGGKAVFSKSEGKLISYVLDGKELLYNEDGIKPQLYRAYLDNDRNIVKHWKKKKLHKLKYVGEITSCKKKDDGTVKVKSEGWLCADDKKIFEFEYKYTFYLDGKIKVDVEVEKRTLDFFTKYEIPRFGVNLLLDKSLSNITYYGLGELENLCDFSEQSTVGIYSSSVKDMCVDYIKPQDSGNHGRTRWMSVTDSEGKGLKFFNCGSYFSFSAHDYPEKQVRDSKHIEDIKRGHLTSISIDGFMRGTGSNSCGPHALPQYRIKFNSELEFSFYIIPIF